MYSDAVLNSNEHTTKLRVAVRRKLSETFDATNYSITCRNCGATTKVLLSQIFMGYLPLKNIDDLLCFQLISNMVGCS
jgi:hypothetical protein